jgi:radical SAM peptide maturase (CXXX-repeat target family)/CXXX repeat peptide maturase
MESKYLVGKGISPWRGGNAQVVTFIVTEDCNLRCKYCYITHKQSNKIMDFETAKKFIDYFLTAPIKRNPAIVLEFIGGEPLIETSLIDKITDYFKVKSYELNNSWYWNYRISISTNGVNYLSKEVQNYLTKNFGKVSLGITLDGTKEKHDINRIFPDGQGSYDSIIKGIPHWIDNYASSTKVTFASEDIGLLKDSIIHLYNLGITEIPANVVFENVWKPGDDLLFENQLIDLADYILDNKLYDKVKISLFDDTIGKFMTEKDKFTTYCGAGKMISIGPNGNLYPCIRYKDFSLNNQNEWIIGNVNDGIDMEKVRPFVASMNVYQSDYECLHCPIATGCGFCQGFNYDESDSGTNFSRAKYICLMHKARVRANNYFFGRLFNDHGILKKGTGHHERKLNILLSDNYVRYCYDNSPYSENKNLVMSGQNIEEIIQFCHREFYTPVFIYDNKNYFEVPSELYKNLIVQHILPIKHYNQSSHLSNSIYVINEEEINLINNRNIDNIILKVNEKNIHNLYDLIKIINDNVLRVNIVFSNITKEFDLIEYERQLNQIAELLINNKSSSKRKISKINVLTDYLENKEKNNCGAGYRNFSIGPNMNIYRCHTEYTEQHESIGNIKDGIYKLKDKHLLTPDYQPICNKCSASQCPNCIILNKKSTNEINVSPSFQCKKSILENKISLDLSKYKEFGESDIKLKENDIKDPIEDMIKELTSSYGYYNY